jgi:hypothetical protein
MQLRMAAASIVGKLSGQLSHSRRFVGTAGLEWKKWPEAKGGFVVGFVVEGSGSRKNLGQNLVAEQVGKGPEMAGQKSVWVRAASAWFTLCRRCQSSQPPSLQRQGGPEQRPQAWPDFQTAVTR